MHAAKIVASEIVLDKHVGIDDIHVGHGGSSKVSSELGAKCSTTHHERSRQSDVSSAVSSSGLAIEGGQVECGNDGSTPVHYDCDAVHIRDPCWIAWERSRSRD